MDESKPIAIVMTVKFRSRLAPEEVRRRYLERMPEFQQLSGLVQKYYVHEESSGEWGGIYLWASAEAMQAYLASDLRKTIALAYEVEGTPRVEVLSVVDQLRP